MTTRTHDTARAARLVSAMAANDQSGTQAVILEAKGDDRLVHLVLALALRHIQVCAEYYDTDMQAVLDEFAFTVNGLASTNPTDD